MKRRRKKIACARQRTHVQALERNHVSLCGQECCTTSHVMPKVWGSVRIRGIQLNPARCFYLDLGPGRLSLTQMLRTWYCSCWDCNWWFVHANERVCCGGEFERKYEWERQQVEIQKTWSFEIHTHTRILTRIPRNTMLTELTYLSMCVVRVCVCTYACLCSCVCVCVWFNLQHHQ